MTWSADVSSATCIKIASITAKDVRFIKVLRFLQARRPRSKYLLPMDDKY